jgi:large subunit ribosomal protein L28
MASHQSIDVKGWERMAARCDICGRKPQYGNRVSHSNRHTKRKFSLNLQHRHMVLNGRPQTVKACTRCLRTMVKVAGVR